VRLCVFVGVFALSLLRIALTPTQTTLLPCSSLTLSLPHRYNTAWLLRLTPLVTGTGPVGAFVQLLELAFVALFLLLRVCNMPLCFLVELQVRLRPRLRLQIE